MSAETTDDLYAEFDRALQIAMDRVMDGAKVRERRQALGLTQQQLAQMLGWTDEHLCRVERGRRPVVPILPLALDGIEARYFRQDGPL